MDRMTEKKVESLIESGNLEITGNVLTRNDGLRAIVEMGAVRWLKKEEMLALMHPMPPVHPMPPLELVIHEGNSYFLELCPFCAGGVTSIRPLGRIWMGMKYSEPSSVEIMHHCDPVPGQPSRPLIRVGRDLPDAIEAWNRRK
jgi:hypothetical protein